MSTRHSALLETLESRRLLSAASEIGLVDSPFELTTAYSRPLSELMVLATKSDTGQSSTQAITRAAIVIPNVRRTYTGSFEITSPTTITGTFKLVVRKEDIRGTFAALRGTLDINTDQFGSLRGEMTYGKIRSNNRINITIVGTNPAFTAVITGKSNVSGSRLTGHIEVTGAATLSTNFSMSKFVVA